MTEKITAEEFAAAAGVADWRADGPSATATFRTGTFAAGVGLVVAIGDLADTANHHPDVDLRYATVRVTLTTHEVGGLSARDATLAAQISQAARDRGIAAG